MAKGKPAQAPTITVNAAHLPLNPNIAQHSTLADVGAHLRGTGNAAALPIRADQVSIVGDDTLSAAIDAAVNAHVVTNYQSDSYRPMLDVLANAGSVPLPDCTVPQGGRVDPAIIAAYVAANKWPDTLPVATARQYAVQVAGMRANMAKVHAKHFVANASPAWRAPYWATAGKYLVAIDCIAASLRTHKGK